MNLYEYIPISDYPNRDQNAYSDDSDSEEQKMLELEASLYSQIHYAENLSNLTEECTFDKERYEVNINSSDKKIVNRNITHDTTPDNENNETIEEECHITTSLYNEILNAKQKDHLTPRRCDQVSDSGMSSCKEDESSGIASNEKVKIKSNQSSNKLLDDSNISDSKYASVTAKRKNVHMKSQENAKFMESHIKSTITIDSSDTVSSSDEDSGICINKQVDKQQNTYPIVALESDENSCDDFEHSKFLEDIKSMDVVGGKPSNLTEIVSGETCSSDSEIEILPGSISKFSDSKKLKTNSLIREKKTSSPTISESRNNLSKNQSSSGTNVKSKVTIIHYDEKQKKRPPKNIVHISASSDSSSDDENVLGRTSLSLNVFGSTRANKSSSAMSFKEITDAESNPINAPQQEYSMLNSPNEDANINGWTSEMYTFYNEINKDDADTDLQQVLQTLNDDPKLWKIGSKDKYSSTKCGSNLRKRYFSPRNQNLRCRNCNHAGHVAKDCNERTRPTVCHMCGIEGHISDECNNTKCLRCGLPNSYYSHTGCMHCRRLNTSECFVCGGKGHVKSSCPDLWRRFHATISGPEGVVDVPFGGVDRSHKSLSQIWCCNCAKKGHYLHHCRAYNYSSYPRTVQHIVNYDNILIGCELNMNISEKVSPSFNSGQKRKEQKREIKERKRAFRSLNHTPNTYQSYGKFSNSMPVTPIESSITQPFNDVPKALEKAKSTLEELLKQDDIGSSSNTWRRQKKLKEKERKTCEYISINSQAKPQHLSVNRRNKRLKDDIYNTNQCETPKKGHPNLESYGNCNWKTSFNSNIDGSKNGSKRSKKNSKCNLDLSYGTSSKPPNLINRLHKLSKIKISSNKNKKNKKRQNMNSKADGKLFKLIEQTIGNTKKSNHSALNQIVKNMKRKK